MYSGIITIILVSFILIGMAFGMIRGFTKSWVRLLCILASAVASFFLASAIGNALASMNIANLNIVVSGEKVTTLSQLIELALQSVGVIKELITSSPTIAQLITALPIVIINTILFIVLFFTINFISWIIYLIVFGIIKKHSQGEEKPKRKFLGVIFSVVQSFVVFLVVMLPIMGVVFFVDKQIDYANSYEGQLEQSTLEGATSANEYAGEFVAYASENANTEDSEGSVDATKKVEEISNNITEVWVFKALKLVGYDKLCISATDRLTQFTINDTKTGLFNEAEQVVKIGVRAEYLFGNNRQISSWTEHDVALLNEVVDKFFDSPIFGDIATEIVTAGAEKWTDETAEDNTFIGLAKPNTSEDVSMVLDAFLVGVKTDNKEDLRGEFKAVVDVADILIKNEVINKVSKNADIKSFIDPISNTRIIADVLTALSKGRAINKTMTQIVQLGINQMYKAIEVAKEQYQNLKISVSSSEINWNTESVILSDMFSNLAKVYTSLQQAGEMKDKLDYDSLASALEKLRESALFEKSVVKVEKEGVLVDSKLNKELTITLLKNSDMSSVDGMNSVINDIEANYDEVNFSTLLNTLKYSVSIADNLSSGEEVSASDVAGLLDGLNDEVVGEIIKNAVTEKLESELGSSSGTKSVSNMVDAVTEYNKTANEFNKTAEEGEEMPTLPTESTELEKTAEVAVEVFKVIQNGESAESTAETKYFATKADLEAFIVNLHSSDYVWSMALLNSETLGFKTNVSETETPSYKTNLTATEYAWALELVDVEYQEGVVYYTAEEMVKLFGEDA